MRPFITNPILALPLLIVGCEAPGQEEQLTEVSETETSGSSESSSGSDENFLKPHSEEFSSIPSDPQEAVLACNKACVPTATQGDPYCPLLCKIGNSIITCEDYGIVCTYDHCGDAVCNGLEGCNNCQSDCGNGDKLYQEKVVTASKSTAGQPYATQNGTPFWQGNVCQVQVTNWYTVYCHDEKIIKEGWCNTVYKTTVTPLPTYACDSQPSSSYIPTFPWLCPPY